MSSSTHVLLIGGPPGAGKTTLGRALAERLGWVSLTADDLITAAQGVTTRDSHPGLWVMKTGDPYAYFTEATPEQLCADAERQHQAVWPAIEAVIRKRARMRNASLVIDGWSLLPERVAALELPTVHAAYIVIHEAELRKRERNNDDFFGPSSDPERMFENFLARSLWWNDTVAEATARLGLQCLEQDGTRSVESLRDEVLGRVRERKSTPPSCP